MKSKIHMNREVPDFKCYRVMSYFVFSTVEDKYAAHHFVKSHDLTPTNENVFKDINLSSILDL